MRIGCWGSGCDQEGLLVSRIGDEEGGGGVTMQLDGDFEKEDTREDASRSGKGGSRLMGYFCEGSKDNDAMCWAWQSSKRGWEWKTEQQQEG